MFQQDCISKWGFVTGTVFEEIVPGINGTIYIIVGRYLLQVSIDCPFVMFTRSRRDSSTAAWTTCAPPPSSSSTSWTVFQTITTQLLSLGRTFLLLSRILVGVFFFYIIHYLFLYPGTVPPNNAPGIVKLWVLPFYSTVPLLFFMYRYLPTVLHQTYVGLLT